MSFTPLGLTICPLFYPALELVLPKAPDAADFEAGEFTFAGQAGDGEWVNPQDPSDLVGGDSFDLLHRVGLLGGSTDCNRPNDFR